MVFGKHSRIHLINKSLAEINYFNLLNSKNLMMKKI